jgi:predicted nuclease of predicted toxin-antitoxin system
MRFLVDAQLPRRLCHRLREHGHDAVHTLDLADANRTSDAVINELSAADERVVMTKDSDFVESLIVHGLPYKLLLVSTGNIRNSELEDILIQNLDVLVEGLQTHVFVEVDRTAIRFHF